MKRVLIGGFISLIGSIWMLAIILLVSNDLTSSWQTPPGRLLTTISEKHLMVFFVIAVIFVILGIVFMLKEYFKKDP